MKKLHNILVTGGCGFIGSNFIRYLFNQTEFKGNIINVDALTYAGNQENLKDIEEQYYNSRYFFEYVNICDSSLLDIIFQKYKMAGHEIDTIINFAAESHVDRSISGPAQFIQTNIVGTFSLLEIAKKYWENRQDVLFHHISTDEVYGSLGEEGHFYELTPYDPRSPYSASKAASDHLVKAYHHTYGIPVTISNCSNNYGPYQYPEKLIPLMILNIKNEKPLPVYGQGKNIRDWIHVDDHASAIWLILNKGKIGETYNIGGDNEWENIRLVQVLCELMAKKVDEEPNYYKHLITYVEDRAGHDFRYAINCDKIQEELGWRRQYKFGPGLDQTIDWYLNNEEWIENLKRS